jgi:hypothetical protein
MTVTLAYKFEFSLIGNQKLDTSFDLLDRGRRFNALIFRIVG